MLFEKLMITIPAAPPHNQLYAWGDNTYGELGDGTVIAQSSPEHIGTNSWSQVSIGTSFTLALKSDKTLWSWGLNNFGQLGLNLNYAAGGVNSPVLIDSANSWKVISNGTSHAAAIKGDGSLWVWGLNNAGQLGDGTTVNKSSPVKLGSSSWSTVSCGASHTLGILTTGVLYGWGLNTSGQIGDLTLTNKSSPVLVSGPASTSWSIIFGAKGGAGYYSLGITTTGQLYGWGFNNSGQVGINTTTTVSSPVLVSGPASTSWSFIAAGQSYSGAITSTGALYMWGDNTYGNLGDGTTVAKISPIKIGTSSWSFIDLGAEVTHGIDSAGRLFGWGYNLDGGVGINTTTTVSSPVLVSGPASTSWKAVSNYLSTLAITINGVLYGWGQNNNTTNGGAPGNGRTGGGSISSPVLVSGPAGASWTAISLNGTNPDTAFGITTTGALYGWGDNIIQNALPVNNYINSPVQVGVSSWTAVAAGGSHSIGITTAGVLYGWGYNTSGQVGINSLTTVSSPVLVSGPTSTSWSTIAAGTFHSIGITSTGKLYTWGLNTAGQLGINSLPNAVSSPVVVSGPAGASWSTIAAGAFHSLGITTAGILYGWGINTAGQLGINSLTTVSSPVVVAPPIGQYSWKQVSAANKYSGAAVPAYHTLAIRSDGTLYGWGLNTSGQVGINSLTNVSSPVLVSGPAGASWSAVAAGGGHSLGITTAGILYAWGDGTYGELGTAGGGTKSSPVLVSGPASTSWVAISAGQYHSLAITSTGLLYGWGLNGYGEVGVNSTTQINSPILVSGPASTSWVAISAGGGFSLGITSTGKLYAWGTNAQSQLGNLSATGNKSSPVLVSGPTGASWSTIAAGESHSLAITTTGQLYAWGNQNYGELGNNLGTTNSSSPVLVSGPTGASWSTIAAGYYQSAAITTTGQLYAWGLNSSGEVGIGSTTASINSPVLVSGPASTSWSNITVGNGWMEGITTAGVLYGWGQNTSGQVGINSLTNASNPSAIYMTGPSVLWSTVAAGASHSLGITTAGILYGWGLNTSGQLGIGVVGGIMSLPSLVSGPASTYWSSLATGQGANHSLAITT